MVRLMKMQEEKLLPRIKEQPQREESP